MDESFRFRLKARGGSFKSNTELSSSLKILYNFSKVFSYCVSVSCDKHIEDQNFFIVQPTIELEYIRKGSLSSLFYVDFPACYAMIQPLIGNYAWDLFKNTFELIKILGEIRAKREVPTVNISGSLLQGAPIIIGNNNSNINVVVVTPEILSAAKENAHYIAGLASAIGPDGADSLKVARVHDKNKLEYGLSIDQKTTQRYINEDQIHESMEVKKYKALIYRLNIKNRNGMAEVNGRSVCFDIEGGKMDDYIYALHGAPHLLHARPRTVVDQFGDVRLDHLFVRAIEAI